MRSQENIKFLRMSRKVVDCFILKVTSVKTKVKHVFNVRCIFNSGSDVIYAKKLYKNNTFYQE